MGIVQTARSPILRPKYVASAGPFFTDDFASGDFSKTGGGFAWGTATRCPVISGFSRAGYSGNSVRFDEDAGGAGGVAELRFTLGASYPQIWLRFYVYYPTGAESPTVGPEAKNTSSNNKFFRIYSLPEPNYPRYGASYYADTISGDQKIGAQAGDNRSASPGSVTQIPFGGSAAYAPLVNASNRGRWVKIEFRVKSSTSIVTPNGEHECWIDDTQQWLVTGIDSSENGQGFDGGYLFGAVDVLWVNAGTYVYIDDFAASSVGRA